MVSISRRRLLVGGAALTAGGYGALRLDRGAPDANLDTWTPDSGTWPLPRYDPANTAHNPNADPPREEPTHRKLASFSTDGDPSPYFRPLVGHDHVVLYGPELVAVPREGGDATRVGDASARQAGFGPDGRLHAVRGRPRGEFEERSTLVGYTGSEMAAAYQTTIDADHVEGMVVGAREVYVGTYYRGLFAVAPEGGRGWRVEGVMPALASGQLYAVDNTDALVAYEERSGLERVLEAGPGRVWNARWVHRPAGLPAVADGRMLAGTYRIPSGEIVVTAHDTATGNQLWVSDFFGEGVATPAVVGDRGYTAVTRENPIPDMVAALDLTTGETLWEDAVEWATSAPVIAGETLVVAGDVREKNEATAGKVRAYDTASGEVLWTVTLDSGEDHDTLGFIGDLALVDDRVLLTAGTSLYELAHN